MSVYLRALARRAHARPSEGVCFDAKPDEFFLQHTHSDSVAGVRWRVDGVERSAAKLLR